MKRCIIGDLGLARKISKKELDNLGFRGTFSYSSPEIRQENSANWTFKTDIWSFGCVFYEMVTLKMAFNDEVSINNYKLNIPENIREDFKSIINK